MNKGEKMHTIFNRTFNFFLAICLVFSALAITPARPARADDSTTNQELTSPADHLNPDGTLNLNENFSGSLDLEGWDVAIDPEFGPVFSQVALPKGDWGIIGEGNGPIRDEVHAIAVDGVNVYIGGSFLDVNNNYAADRIVKWNGSSWSALGDNSSGSGSITNGQVNAIAVDTFDGGIYVGGSFTNVNNHGTSLFAADFIAHWDGTDWSALGTNFLFDGALNNTVNSIILNWDIVIAGGDFTSASNFGGAVPATNYIAQFDKTSATWSAMGSTPLNNVVRALNWGEVGMYAGGDFTNAGGVAEADYIARFNFGTSTWSALGNNGAGNGSLNGPVYAISVETNGVDIVYVGGSFTEVYDNDIYPMLNVSYLTVWGDYGGGWDKISDVSWPLNDTVRSITLIGSDVYVGGDFNNAGGIPEADHIVKLSFGVWSALGNNGAGNGAIPNSVFALATNGTSVFAGGAFDVVQNGNTTLYQNNYFSQWEIGIWIANTPRSGSLTSKVNSVAVNGTDVYVGGEFINLSNNGVINPAADYIAKWDGTNWSNLGGAPFGLNGSLNGAVNSIAVSGSNIYVGGNFTDVNNNGGILTAADYITKWNGTNWSALGSTVALNAPVNALAVKSNFVYVGGSFQNAGGISAADYFAKFDTVFNGWSSLGNNGLPSNGSLNSSVYAIALQGDYIYVGGAFTNVNSNGLLLPQADYIARWDLNNSEWLPVGSGSFPALSNTVYALLSSKLNTTDVYVGGSFINVTDNFSAIPQADYIAKWNGTNWSAIGDDGSGNGALTGTVRAIAMFGNQIFAGGTFVNAKSAAGDYILEWDGTNWKTLSSTFLGNGSLYGTMPVTGVYALAVSNNLYVGGEFYNITDGLTFLSQADYIAAYGVDNISPTVVSMIRKDPSPTTAASVQYTVTFSEHITGIDSADFTLTTSGVSSAVVSGVSGSGSVYTVTVNTGVGNGTIRLNVVDNNSIVDTASNSLGGAAVGDGDFTSGEAYTVTKSVESGTDTTGVFRPSNGLLYLKHANTTGFADVAINYGTAGDYPVAGDWDGNGTVTIGIYRNGTFYLRNSNTVGFANLVFAFGQPGDQPVAGDWNGDGTDTIGVYRNGLFLLRNSNSAGAVDTTFALGNPGDIGIAGDWNGDGMDTTGVFRPSNGVIFLKNTNTSGFADVALNYGLSGDRPVIGDWNNDGMDTIGVYRNAQFYLRNSNTNGFADLVFALGNPGDMPIAGDWDGLP